MIIDAYLYCTYNDLLWVDTNPLKSKINAPMNKRLIKLHKGVDNSVKFRVRNEDLKAVDVRNYDVRVKLVNPQNREKVYDKYVCVSQENKGWMHLCILEGDLVNIPAGFYDMVLQAEDRANFGNTPDYYSASPFYTNEVDDVTFEVEIVASGDSQPVPSFEVTWNKLTPSYMGSAGNFPSYYTSAIPCNKIRNHLNSIHSFALYGDNFSGKVEVFGSLDMEPSTDISDYFPVFVEGSTPDLNFNKFTGIEAYTVKLNLMWVRFRITPDPELEDSGELSKIIWRS